VIVSPDEMRTDADGHYHPEWDVRDEAIRAWAIALQRYPISAILAVGAPASGKTTWVQEHRKVNGPGYAYYDATLTHRPTRSQLIRMAREAGVEVVIVWVCQTREECLRRNALRERKTPEAMIVDMDRQLRADPPHHQGVETRVVVG
jgi:predicted kinase